jgi:hypothetical protein
VAKAPLQLDEHWMRISDEGESLGRIGAICLEPQPPRATAQTWGASMAGLGIRWAPFFFSSCDYQNCSLLNENR